MLTLKKYKVTDFRSVKDSGWIETDAVTALIGTNESGKTNLLVPLWKLNPAKDGAINLIADYPRASYSSMKADGLEVTFIAAEFVIDDELKDALAKATGVAASTFDTVVVSRKFSGKHFVHFPSAIPQRKLPRTVVDDLIATAIAALKADKTKTEKALLAAMVVGLDKAVALVASWPREQLVAADLELLEDSLAEVPLDGAAEHSTLKPRWEALVAEVSKARESLELQAVDDMPGIVDLVVKHLPKFVYYSNYGNLDSEIYLPQVLANMKREGLGTKEEAKARTLKVLFDYVRISPDKILELGKGAVAVPPAVEPTKEAIQAATERTKERDIFLRSADTELTKSFQEWWKQGDYRFRFAADGDHFRIWVSDSRRLEDIELESRSTGLQWFFSFFLVFLVERQDAHRGAVLLLDEPGLTLHPLSQKDLALFFDDISKTNPIVYTTHSPFMLDYDRIDRARSVYVDSNGLTVASADLRASVPSSPAGRSVYAVHAALGLSVSDALLQGSAPVLVEGSSDQHYLTGVKTVLIARRKIAPKRDIVFVPFGGAKGANTIAPIIGAKGELPIVILDDDGPGRIAFDALRKGPIYVGDKDRLVNIKDFVGYEKAEIEDLLRDLVIEVASRMYRGNDDDFDEVAVAGPIVPQIESFAAANGLTLDQGWKVDLARNVKQKLLKQIDTVSDAALETWVKLFAIFER